MGHIKSRMQSKKNLSWKEEVEKAREWRDLSDQSLGTHEEQKEKGPKESEFSELFSQETEAAKILDNNKLDGRAIDTNGTLRKHSIGNMIKSLPGILLGIFLLPFLFLSSGLILILCTYLGNITDEGEDARTSIHFVGFILTPFVYWSLMSAISVFY